MIIAWSASSRPSKPLSSSLEGPDDTIIPPRHETDATPASAAIVKTSSDCAQTNLRGSKAPRQGGDRVPGGTVAARVVCGRWMTEEQMKTEGRPAPTRVF